MKKTQKKNPLPNAKEKAKLGLECDFSKTKITKKKLKKNLLLNAKEKAKHRLVCDVCKEPFPTWWEIRDHWMTSGHKDQEQCRW